MDGNRRIEGTLELPAGVLVSNELLDTTWPVQIAGIEGTLSFPRRQVTDGKPFATDLLTPSAANQTVSFVDDPRSWGQVVRSPTEPASGDSFVTHVHLSFDIPDSPSDWKATARDCGDRIGRATQGFLELLFAWLQAMSQQDIDPADPFRYSGTNSNPRLVALDELDRTFFARTPIAWGITPSHPVTAAMWETALRQASTGIDIPLARQLLNSARSALARGNHRRAVIDASTAAEISIVAAIKAKLGPENEAVVVAELLRSASGLGGKLHLCKRLGVEMAASPQEKLVKIRNPADHEGWTPPRPDAEGAVRCAAEVVEAHVPLPGWP